MNKLFIFHNSLSGFSDKPVEQMQNIDFTVFTVIAKSGDDDIAFGRDLRATLQLVI